MVIRRGAVSVVAILGMVGAMLFGVTAPNAAAAPWCNPFPDVDSSNVHCENIEWLAAVGITKPIGGKYKPNDVVNRGSMSAFLFRLLNPGKAAPKCYARPFKDVPVGHTFCGSIQWAVDEGIAKGYPDGAYRPANKVTRGAMAAFLQRASSETPAPKCTSAPFRDVKASDIFCAVITWAKSNGITHGVGDGSRYGTTQAVKRGSMASFLKRIADQSKSQMVVGDSATYWTNGKKTAVITVESLRRMHTGIGPYDDPPQNTYIVIGVKVAAFSGVRETFFGTWHVNPFNWYLQDSAGYQYEPNYSVDIDHRLSSQDLGPGEMVRGNIVFDGPSHGRIVLSPVGSDSKTTWKY